MHRRVVNGACVLGVLVSGLSVFAHDWPQFLGPERNGVHRGPRLATSWPAGGPKRAPRRRVGEGLSRPVVASERVVGFLRPGYGHGARSLAARARAPRPGLAS